MSRNADGQSNRTDTGEPEGVSPRSMMPVRGLTPSGSPREIGYGAITRRQMLAASGLGFGTLALRGIAAERATGLAPQQPHTEPRAKAVVMLVQNGGPSQMDLFDPKPELTKKAGVVHATKVETFQKGSEAN